MKNQWKALQLGLLLVALPLVATAAVSANQWMQENSPIELKVDTAAFENSGIGVDRIHQVSLNANGAVEGRIAAINSNGTQGIADLGVYFLNNGKVVKEAKTGQDGSFVVTGLQEGVYSFIATGANGFAAYGVHVVSEAEGVNNIMEAAAVSPEFATLRQLVSQNLPALDATAFDEKINPAPNGANRVALVDGKLQGTIHALLGGQEAVRGTRVHILQNDQQIASVETDELGNFSVADFAPGVYSLLATGPSGIAAVAFEAVATDESVADKQESDSAFQQVSFTTEPVPVKLATALNVCLTCGYNPAFQEMEDVGYTYDPGYVNDYVPVDYVQNDCMPIEYASESICCGGAMGGSGGAVGNFAGIPARGGFGPAAGGGIGRLGRLALLGGTVVGIVAIADDDDSAAASNADPN